MSSIVGHALVGATVFLVTNRDKDRRALRALPVFVLLAVAPDFDYFAIWLWGFVTRPRATHTVIFAIFAAFLAWRFTRGMHRAGDARVPFFALLIAALSHTALDYWVGAHPMKLLWPFIDAGFEAPVALLPSAARLRHGNLYLWRNTLIEIAVLLPPCALAVACARDASRRVVAKSAMFVVPVWLGFLFWSMSLSR
jgi:inner membrane protein